MKLQWRNMTPFAWSICARIRTARLKYGFVSYKEYNAVVNDFMILHRSHCDLNKVANDRKWALIALERELMYQMDIGLKGYPHVTYDGSLSADKETVTITISSAQMSYIVPAAEWLQLPHSKKALSEIVAKRFITQISKAINEKIGA